MQENLVSIIIPTYNRAHLIGQTLASVLAQTYQDWECIVVDDGSNDYTDELMEFYTEKDDRIQYYHRPENRPKGANACRNYGFELSKGEFINWFDSDDLMSNTKLAEQLKVLKKNYSLSFCTCEYGLYDKNFELIAHRPFHSSNLLEDYITGKAFFNFQTCLFRRRSLFKESLNENLFKAQEMEFFFRYLQQDSVGYAVLNKELVKVRLHDNNITQSFKLGNKKAIASEMDVRLMGLQILNKKASQEDNLNIALTHYMQFLKVILIQKKLKLYYRYLYALREVLRFKDLFRWIKLAFVGILFRITNKGLYYFRREFNF